MPAPFYRNTGPWGSGKGSRLTSLEIDQTIYALVQEIDDAVASIPDNTGISEVTYDEASITFHLTDATTAPFTVPLPVATFHPRGAWTNNQQYFYLDLLLTSVGLVLVLEEHTTASAPAEFDADAVDGDGDPLYSTIVPFQNLDFVVRDRGLYAASAEYVEDNLVQSVEFGLFIVEEEHTSAATFDPNAETGGNEPLYRQIAPPVRTSVSTVSTAVYTPQLTDENHYLRMTNASGCIVAVPSSSEVLFAIGTEIHFYAATDGEVTFNAGSDVVINPVTGFDNIIRQRGGVVTIKKVATDDWDIFGALKDASSGA